MRYSGFEVKKFTTRSYYEFIQNHLFIETSLPHLWAIKAPPRVLIFF
jgi:hypothetical protein